MLASARRTDALLSSYSYWLRTSLRRAWYVVPALLLVVTGFSAVVPMLASAAPSSSSSGQMACSAAKNVQNNGLAVDRWGDQVGALHARLSANAWDDVEQKTSRYGLEGTFLSIGNTEFETGTDLLNMSNQFCPGQQTGSAFDKAGGQFANQILGSGLLTILAVITVCGALYAAYRMNPRWGMVGKMLLIMGVFAGMATAAGHSNGNGYAAGSPEWAVNGVNKVVSGVSAKITGNNIGNSSLDNSVLDVAGTTAKADAQTDNISCLNFVNHGLNIAAQEETDDSKENDSNQGVSLNAEVTAQELDQMWQITGLPAYIQTQYGQNNTYGWQGFCWPLDRQSGVTAYDPSQKDQGTTEAVALNIGAPTPTNIKSRDGNPLWYPSNNTDMDEAGVFGASCWYSGSGWKAADGWQTVKNSHADKGDYSDAKTISKECSDEWNGKPTVDGAQFSDYAWNWQDDSSGNAKDTSSVPLDQINKGHNPGDFLSAWHGNTGASGVPASMIYVATAFILMVIFGGLAAVVFLCKLLLLAMGLMTFFVLLAEMIPNHNGLGKFLRHVLGVSMLAFGFSVLLGLVMSMTAMIVTLGTGMGLTGFMLTLWTGVSPLLAVVIFSVLWKHYMKAAPNPLNPRSMLGYAKSSSSIGNAAIGGAAGWLAGARRAVTGGGRNAAAGQGVGGRPGEGQSNPVGAGRDGKVNNVDVNRPDDERTGGMGAGLSGSGAGADGATDTGADGVEGAGVEGADADDAGTVTGAADGSDTPNQDAVVDRYGSGRNARDHAREGSDAFAEAFGVQRKHREKVDSGRMRHTRNAFSEYRNIANRRRSTRKAERRAGWQAFTTNPMQKSAEMMRSMRGKTPGALRTAASVGAPLAAAAMFGASAWVAVPAVAAAGGIYAARHFRKEARQERASKRAVRERRNLEMYAAMHKDRANENQPKNTSGNGKQREGSVGPLSGNTSPVTHGGATNPADNASSGGKPAKIDGGVTRSGSGAPSQTEERTSDGGQSNRPAEAAQPNQQRTEPVQSEQRRPSRSGSSAFDPEDRGDPKRSAPQPQRQQPSRQPARQAAPAAPQQAPAQQAAPSREPSSDVDVHRPSTGRENRPGTNPRDGGSGHNPLG